MKKPKNSAKEKATKLNSNPEEYAKLSNFNPERGVPVFLLMAGPTIPNKFIAVLVMPKPWGDRVNYAKAIYGACLNNPNITFSAGDQGVFLNKLNNFLNAQELVNQKVYGASGNRDTAWDDLNNYLQNAWKWLIQGAADAAPANAQTIITSCLYRVKNESKSSKPSFAVTYIGIPGSVKLSINVKQLADQVAPKSKSVQSVVYMYSLDNVRWEIAKGSLLQKSKCIVNGFTPGELVYFKAQAAFTKNRLSPWVYSGGIIIV